MKREIFCAGCSLEMRDLFPTNEPYPGEHVKFEVGLARLSSQGKPVWPIQTGWITASFISHGHMTTSYQPMIRLFFIWPTWGRGLWKLLADQSPVKKCKCGADIIFIETKFFAGDRLFDRLKWVDIDTIRNDLNLGIYSQVDKHIS